MKVGILTLFHGNDNWGGVLQGYALKTYLEQNFPNTKADLVRYHSGANIIYTSKFKQALQYSPVEIMVKVFGSFKRRGAIGEKLNIRKKLFEDFRKEYTTNEKIYYDEDISRLADEYDCLICGSDQVWNPNVGRAGYFLCGVDNQCTKASYAASIARDDLSSHEVKMMLPLIEKFDYVSVREKTAKNILEKYNDGTFPVTEVLDPALMLTSEQWKKKFCRYPQNERYALAFFFSESYLYRKEIEKICREKKLTLKFIPYAKGYIESDDLGKAERLFDVGPQEFLELFAGAKYVFTDSFHGAAFSINFNKPFVVFERDKNNKVSKNSRLYDLLDKFDLSSRLIRQLNNLQPLTESPIDYHKVNVLLDQYRKQSHNFLDTVISSVVPKHEEIVKTVGKMDKELCCGCGVCAEECPRGSITMKADQQGFLYPSINTDTCIKCGKCVKICTTQKVGKSTEKAHPDTYVGFNENADIRKNSSSGGLFYQSAKYILEEKHGVVYGAKYNDEFDIVHERAENMNQLQCFMKSKYVQSNMNHIFAAVLKDLKDGRTVLFSGTPCQVSAIRSYVDNKGKYDKLYLIDFICHGVPSPGVWKSYLSYLSHKHSDVQSVDFRDKVHGWHNFFFTVKFKNGRKYSKSHETDPFMRSFLSDRNIRPSCYYCKFKSNNYSSDITLGDAWKIEKDNPEWADDKGVSLFLVRTAKGRELLDKSQNGFTLAQTDYDRWVCYNPSISFPTAKPSGRSRFFEDFSEKGNKEFWSKMQKIPVKKQIRYYSKCALHITGAEKLLRRKK